MSSQKPGSPASLPEVDPLEPPVRVEASTSTLAPLKHPVFRAVWFASLASNFGGLIQSVGASWLMTSIAASAQTVALVQAANTLPIMLFSLLAGAIADNYDRRKVMLVAQIYLLLISVSLTLFSLFGLITPGILLAFTFLIGCGGALNGPAWQSSVGEMVPRSDLPAAVSLNSLGFNITRSVGPAIGGAIVAAAGAAAAFAINGLSYLALIAVLFRWRPERPVRTLPPEHVGDAMAAGLRYVAMSPIIRNVLGRSFLFGLAASSVPALMPLVARDLVGGGPLTYGLLLGAFGIGAVGGALSTGRLRGRMAVEGIVRLGFLGFAICSSLAAVSAVLPLTMLAMAIGGASWVIALSTFNVTVQLSAPRWVVGRALALYQMAAFGGMAGGSAIWGWLADAMGPAEGLLASAVVQALGVAIGFVFALPKLEDANLDPLSRWSEPAVAVEIQPQTGPVVIAIEYQIHQADIPQFLTAMDQRRRIRRRDGARNWVLLRDLADPELWVERFHTPTWVEYVRHNQRRTQADAAIGERLRALHRGETPPQVHRMIERQTRLAPLRSIAGVGETVDALAEPSLS